MSSALYAGIILGNRVVIQRARLTATAPNLQQIPKESCAMNLTYNKLGSLERSAINRLSTGTADTAAIASALGSDAKYAANILCALRKLGLLFSHNKKPSQTYAVWELSAAGMHLFQSRDTSGALVSLNSPLVNELAELQRLRNAQKPVLPKATGTLAEQVQVLEATAHALLTERDELRTQVNFRTAERNDAQKCYQDAHKELLSERAITADLKRQVTVARNEVRDVGHVPSQYAVVTHSVGSTGTLEQAKLSAAHYATATGKTCTVIGLIAEIAPVDQPTFITLL